MEEISALWEAIEPFISWIGDVAITIIEGLGDIFEKVAGVIEEHGPEISEIIAENAEAFQEMWEIVEPILNALQELVGSVFEFIGDIVSSTIGSAMEILGGLIEFLDGVFTGDWEKAWNGILDIFKGIWNGVVGSLEAAINFIIRGINWLIDQLNKVKFDVPDWVPAIGGKTFGFNVSHVQEVKLPKLANGAVIPPNQQFAAVLGDQRSGKNLEAPANLIRQMVAEGIQMAGGVGRRSGNMTIIMESDGREFGRASYKYGTAEQQRVGVRLAEVRA